MDLWLYSVWLVHSLASIYQAIGRTDILGMWILHMWLSSAIYLIIIGFKGISSSEPSLWMAISQQSICDAGLGSRMFHFLQGWHSWQIQYHTKLISGAAKKPSRYVRTSHLHILQSYSLDLVNSQVHATHIRPLSKQTPVGLTWMSQALEQLLVVMGSLSLPQWWISRRERGVLNLFIYPVMHMKSILIQAN